MGEVARTERAARASSYTPAPVPRRRPRRRPGETGAATWNVLVEEIVPFQAPPETASAVVRLRHPARCIPEDRHLVAVPVRQSDLASLPSPAWARDQAADARSRRVASRPRGLRRLLPGAATLAVLASAWLGVGALSGLHRPELSVPASAIKVHGGYVYVARPGDTLWSIASGLEPGGDPRILVANFEQQLHGSELVPGDELKLP